MLGLAPSTSGIPMVIGMLCLEAIAVTSWLRRHRVADQMAA